MPAQEGLGLHDHQGVTPFEPPRQHGQADSGDGIQTPRTNSSFHEHGQLATKEEILGTDSICRSQQQHQPTQGVFDQTNSDLGKRHHDLIVPQCLGLANRPRRASDGIFAEHSSIDGFHD